MLPDHCTMPTKAINELNWNRGVTDFDRLSKAMARGEVRFVIAAKGEVPRPIGAIVFKDYRFLRDCGKFSVYQWLPATNPPPEASIAPPGAR